jgi:hypothetical protein
VNEETETFRILHKSELRDLYKPASIVRLVRFRWIRWAGHAAEWGRQGMHTGF